MPTTNPVPSTDPVDFIFNVGVIDRFATSEDEAFADRLGNERKTLAGLTADVEAAATTAIDEAIPGQVALVSEAVAATYVGQAGASATAAATSAAVAEAAKDFGFANAKGAATISDARALVADTETFIVYAPGAATFVAYRRTSSTTQELLGEYPSASAAIITSGDVFPDVLLRNDNPNGAVRIVVGGRNVGLTIPAGQTAANAALGCIIPSTGLTGKTIRLVQRYTATAGFSAAIDRSTVSVQSRTSGNVNTNLTVTDYSFTQVGTEVTQYSTVTVPSDSANLHHVFIVASGNTAEATDFSIQITGAAYQILSGSSATQTIGDNMLDERLAPIFEDLAALDERITATEITSGDVFPVSPTRFNAANGATTILDGSKVIGLNLPSGQTGRTSFVCLQIDAVAMRGETVQLSQIYTATAGLAAAVTRGTTVALSFIGTTSSVLTVTGDTFTQVGTQIVQTGTVVVPADADVIGLCYQVSSSSPTLGASYAIQIAQATYKRISADNDEMLDFRVNAAIAAFNAEYLAGVSYSTTELEAGEGKTYASPKAANDAITAETLQDRSQISLYRGTYTDLPNWVLANYATIKGYGGTTPVIHFEEADGSAVDPSTVQPLWVTKSGTLDGVKVTGRNCRYAVHAESGSTHLAVWDAVVRVKNSWIEHLGNTNLGWDQQSAWGSGISSGWDVESTNNIYRSPFCPFSYHTNAGFEKPTIVKNYGDSFINTSDSDSGIAYRIQPLGSGQVDQCILVGNTFVGDIVYEASTLYTGTDWQPADHSEIKVSGYGNTPAVFKVTDTGFSLRIRTYTGAGSAVTVSGDAVPIIFGDVTTFPGVTNIPAYLAGDLNVRDIGIGPAGDVYITGLGKRLGNCTSVNKTLNVTANGFSGTMVFNADYTAVNNTTLLAAINTALGLSGKCVVDTYRPGSLYRPRFTDEEKTLLNNTAVGILMGSILAYDGSYKKIRLMTSADPASLFAGVAWQDIYPGEFGRVKTRGWLPITDIRTSASTLVFGTTMSVGATAGSVDAGGSQGLLRAIRADAVEVAR